MRRRSLLPFVQTFSSVHRGVVERDYADASRREAKAMQAALATARPSGRLGDGRLADLEDAKAAGLFDSEGLFVGARDGKMLFFDGTGPLLTYIRTGGGKGRDLILPNLAHLRSRSLIVTDLKDGENSFASYQHRKDTLGIPCVNLDPYNVRGEGNTPVNPMQFLVDVVRAKGAIDSEAREMTQILLPSSPKGEDNWARDGGQNLLCCRMEYLALFEPERCAPENLWRFVNANEDQLSTDFAMMATCGHEGIGRRAGALELTFSKAPKQFEAYKAEAMKAVEAFEPGKALANATNAHEFDFARLRHEPHTVYLTLPADKIGVAGPWVSLILNYAIERIAGERGQIRTTFILDEFPQLPPAPAIMKALRVYREKGIQLWFFAQGRFSMEGKWSREAVKEFEDQAAILMLKGVREPDLIRDVELWSGNETVLTRGVSHNGGTVETAAANMSETRRAVLQSEDILSLGEKLILRVASMPRLLVADAVPFYDVEPWKWQIRDIRDLHNGGAK